MAAKQRMRLILCGVCFEPDCPWSKWVSDDDDSGEGIPTDIIEDLQEMFMQNVHDEIEQEKAKKLSQQEKQKRIETAIETATEETGQTVEIANLDELLGNSVQVSDSKLIIEKDSLLDDILNKYADHIEKPNDDQKQKEH